MRLAFTEVPACRRVMTLSAGVIGGSVRAGPHGGRSGEALELDALSRYEARLRVSRTIACYTSSPSCSAPSPLHFCGSTYTLGRRFLIDYRIGRLYCRVRTRGRTH